MKVLVNSFCFNCGNELDYKSLFLGLCKKCVESIQRIDISTSCERCGLPNENERCFFCEENSLEFDRNISLYVYEGLVKDLIQSIKFKNDIYKVRIVNHLTKGIVLDSIFNDFIDVVIPVPSSLISLLNRGFDLVKLVFKPIAKFNRKPFLRLISKKPFSKQQKKLSKEDRINFIKNSFYVKRNLDLSGKVVLLCDDVFTTGNTLNACAILLKKFNPKKIYSLTFARVI